MEEDEKQTNINFDIGWKLFILGFLTLCLIENLTRSIFLI